MKDKLLSFKKSENFPPNEWESRGLNPSSEERISQMEQVIHEFVDFLIKKNLYEINDEDFRLHQIQEWINEWDSFDFDTEETEFIVDVMCDCMRKINFDFQKLLI